LPGREPPARQIWPVPRRPPRPRAWLHWFQSFRGVAC
jgi:hypothetical protein